MFIMKNPWLHHELSTHQMFVLNLYTQLEHSASLMDNSGRLMFLIIEFSHIFFFVL